MTTQVKVTKIDGAAFMPLSDEMMNELELKVGDSVEVAIDDSRQLVVRRSPDDDQTEFKRAKEKVFDKYSDVFTALAEGAK